MIASRQAGTPGPLVIGLAGTIAAGKSTVAALLEERGAVHCDGDKLVHTLYAPGTPGFERVVEAFGQDIVGPDGLVDRKLLGARVFGKPVEMNRLTTAIGSITEAIKRVVDGWRRDLEPGHLAVIEAVNLMEPGFAIWCDQVWLIGASDAVARQRLIETRGMSEAEVNQRLKSMVPLEARAPGCDWVYRNDGTRAELAAAVSAELERVCALHSAGTLGPSKFAEWWRPFIEMARPALRQAGVVPADEV